MVLLPAEQNNLLTVSLNGVACTCLFAIVRDSIGHDYRITYDPG
jgi:hypothetical protein